MTTKMSIALAVLALLMPCYLSAPRQPRDTVISCSDGSHLPPTCPLAEPLADCFKGNRNLWLIMCSSRVVQQLAKGVCFNLSKSNDAKAECCAYSPTLSDTAKHTPGELVSNLTTSVVLGRGLVQLGQQVCEAEKVKLLQGCQNQYDDCREILQRTEKLHVSVIKEVLSFGCGRGRMLPNTTTLCHYDPTETPQTPSNVTANLRGFAQQATKFANTLLWTLFTNQIGVGTISNFSIHDCKAQLGEKPQVVDTAAVCY